MKPKANKKFESPKETQDWLNIWEKIDQYKARIEDLKAENDRFKVENKKLKEGMQYMINQSLR